MKYKFRFITETINEIVIFKVYLSNFWEKQYMIGSLAGAATSKKVTEVYKGSFYLI